MSRRAAELLATVKPLASLSRSQKKFFRRLGRDAQGSLVVAHEEGGKDVITTYTDEAIIELFLSSLTGRVEAVLRKIK